MLIGAFVTIFNIPNLVIKVMYSVTNQSVCAFTSGQVLITIEQPISGVRNATAAIKLQMSAGIH